MDNQIDAKQAANLLGCSISLIRRFKEQGKLPFTQLGGRYKFDRQDVLKLKQRVDPTHNEPELE